MSIITCTPRILTPEREALARRRSVEINPANEELTRTVERVVPGRRGQRRLALQIGTRWPEAGVLLSVQFLDNPSQALRKRLLLHMNAWSKTTNTRFVETQEKGHVRIARFDQPPDMAGFWSWVGTEILAIEDEEEPTMNLEGFTMDTEDSEFFRVVRHEAGHTLGFDHEHMRSDLVNKIDVKKAIAHFKKTDGWTAKETRQQVLTPLKAKSIMGTTEADPTSIMCYQIPGKITKDGKTIPGGLDINKKDFEFAAKVYPKTGREPLPPRKAKAATVDPESFSQLQSAVQAPPREETFGQRRNQPLSQDEADTFHIVVMDEFDPEGIRSSLADCEPEVVPSSVGGTTGPKPGKPGRKKTKTPKFARVFASYAGARVTCAMRLRADKGEDPTTFGSIIGVHHQIKNYTNRDKGSLPDDEKMKAFGTNLFDALFPGVVGRLYDEARSRQRNRKLDLVFTSMIPWIAEKPWEFAYDKVRDSYLATEEIHLIRNVLTAVPANIIPARVGPLRILVVSAQPVGFGLLSIEQEVRVILRGFQPLIDANAVTVEVLAHATPSLIHGQLETGNFDVIHFIGHGMFNEETGQGALIFENDRGGKYELGERSVREIFCQRGVRLVFLNACQTGSGGSADFNKGVAQSLVAHGLPALVANQYSVLDTSATSFAQHFYWALAQGMSIGQAAREARIAVNYSLMGEPIDWAVPVVYARDPNMKLCEKPEMIDPVPATAVRRVSRRAVRGRPMRVAFWDIDNVFPGLEDTLKRMNDAQTVFGFELVALSAPIDAWDLENKADDGSPYLWANKIAERLKRTTDDLGVNILACITRQWMRDAKYLNIYGWWADHKETPVVMFSCAGLDDLAPEGEQTNQVLANIMVLLLAGYLSEMDTHGRGPKSCPMYRNSERDFAHMFGPQPFDKICRAELKKKIPKELPALETLLKTFHPS
jgi:hypothetical protein